jgi:hypothetical protein
MSHSVVALLEDSEHESLSAMRWWMPALCVASLTWLAWQANQPASPPLRDWALSTWLALFSILALLVVMLYGRHLASNTAVSALFASGSIEYTTVSGRKFLAPAAAQVQYGSVPLLSPLGTRRLVAVYLPSGACVYLSSSRVVVLKEFIHALSRDSPSKA